MFKIIIILLIIIPSITSYAYERNCSRIMDEPFKEYQEEAKDEHSAFYVVVSNDHGCEYGSAIELKSYFVSKLKLITILSSSDKFSSTEWYK